MALKDLVAQKAALTEEAIEKVVAEYVRYDTDTLELVFTPEAVNLANRDKVIVYLTALQGWAFVTDEAVPMDAKPAELEEELHIPGGSLRPILKDLKDRHLLLQKSGRYSVRATGLAAIEKALNSETKPIVRKRKKPPKNGPKTDDALADGANKEKPKKAKSMASASSGKPLGEKFSAWIADGYFDEPRTGKDVQNRFHKEAIIVPRTSIPAYLLSAVRNGKLEREKATVNNKEVWVYTTKS